MTSLVLYLYFSSQIPPDLKREFFPLSQKVLPGSVELHNDTDNLLFRAECISLSSSQIAN